MADRLVEVIDIDGSGLYALRRVLMSGLRAAYFSPTLDHHLTSRFSKTASGLRHRNLVIKALSSGKLRQLRTESELGGAEAVIISRILNLNPSFSEKEFIGLHRKIAKHLRRRTILVDLGISPPGLTERVVEELVRHTQLTLDGELRLYYLAHPALMGSRIPLGGSVAPDSRSFLRALTGGRNVIEGLSYREAELLAIMRLLANEALTAVNSESYLLAKRYGVSPAKLLASLGAGIDLPSSSRLRGAILRYLWGIERTELGLPGVADRSSRLSLILERELVASLKRARKLGRGAVVLVIGSGEPLKILRSIARRSLKISHLSSGRFIEGVSSPRGAPRRVDIVVLASRNRAVREKVYELYKGQKVIIDLNRYVGVEWGK